MPVASTGVYEVVLKQDYLSQEVLNVFHYVSNVGEDDIQQECGDAFDVDNLPDISIIQSEELDYKAIIVRNLTGDLADAVITPTTASGLVVGLELPSFVAASFRYNRQSKDTRNGSKRFCGMIEENVTQQVYEAAFQALLATLATVLDNSISNAGKTFQPIILHKPADGAGVFTFSTLNSVISLGRVTTQNSRKSF